MDSFLWPDDEDSATVSNPRTTETHTEARGFRTSHFLFAPTPCLRVSVMRNLQEFDSLLIHDKQDAVLTGEGLDFLLNGSGLVKDVVAGMIFAAAVAQMPL